MNEKPGLGERIKHAIGVKGDFKTAIVPMINYSYANMFMGGAGYIISMYFTIFLTDVVNISLKSASLVVMFATLWDAVTDPAMGIITDRTRSKTGKHRRYLLWGIPVLMLSYGLLWNSYGLNGNTSPAMAMLYYTLVYMLYKTAYTIIAVPHTAMLPELAPDYDLRTQYNSVGYLFNSAGMVPSFLFAVAILMAFGSNNNITSASRPPFLVIGLVLAVFYGGAVFLTYSKTREPSSLNNELPPFDFRHLVNEYVLVFKNKAFRQYFFMSLAYMFATGFYGTTKVYYIKYLANQYGSYALFNAVAGVAEASAFPLNYALTMKYGKKRCGNIVTPLMVAGLAIGLLMQTSTGGSGLRFLWLALMMLSMILYPFGMSGLGFVSTNIFPDLTDVDELITGRRREGVIATFSTLIKKSISGVMAALVGFILQGFGLVTGDTVAQYEKETGQLYGQTSHAVFGIRLCVAIIPIVAALISLFLLRRFQMTKADHAMIRAAIATKHKYGSVTLTSEQIARCEAVSGQKYETTWLGAGNDGDHPLETDENGDFTILAEADALAAQYAAQTKAAPEDAAAKQ
ncbi:MAG: MFS transporter [Clostridia bacterium]|nr:MFS transporter [Clostridia bacterium]